jgi:hypothetical protein
MGLDDGGVRSGWCVAYVNYDAFRKGEVGQTTTTPWYTPVRFGKRRRRWTILGYHRRDRDQYKVTEPRGVTV